MKYHPITDSIKLIPQQLNILHTDEFNQVYPSLSEYLDDMGSKGIQAKRDLQLLLRFLNNVVSSSIGTQNRFRNEAERFVLFCWNEKQKSILDIGVDDIREYIDWIWSPPNNLIANTTIASRFKSKTKTDIRLVNNNWRPFVLRQSKADRKTEALIAQSPQTNKPRARYKLNQTSLQNSYASLNVFLKELTESEHLTRNPVLLVKKSCKYLVKGTIYKPPHTLDDDIWQLFIDTLTQAADENPIYERHRFLVLSLKVLFLRISELSDRNFRTPVFGDFCLDLSGEGWVLNVIGKGKKERLVTVPDGFIDNVLTRYREYLGLPPLPQIDESYPIMPSQKTGQALHQDSLNNMVEEAFDLVIKKLVKDGKHQQAQSIAGASSHWLRHTGATQALGEITETMLAEELGHASVKTTVEIYVAPAHRDRIKAGTSRKL
ncbi:tyrosine-type recombinase/integrase [Paraglaciecola aquimarina]|uniref:Tyrosine-type recombinase/integrase n=1 Tax=Paraglaciecola algarum TaxID=3050085 RepID=A0ABS9D309_9ALTE|nr:tyrosine-type recombinase/integrase [Paraglaciecola sp. G1-23]MCF2947125.1 tyrosine-type recombinase/integrase [Paraglaciecola sp. G1-23]